MNDLVEVVSLFLFGFSVGYTLPLVVKLAKLYLHG